MAFRSPGIGIAPSAIITARRGIVTTEDKRPKASPPTALVKRQSQPLNAQILAARCQPAECAASRQVVGGSGGRGRRQPLDLRQIADTPFDCLKLVTPSHDVL